MKKSILIFLMCLLATTNAMAQLPHDFRSERIFLGVSDTEWGLNDTIDVKGMIVCSVTNDMIPYSKYLYIELINSSDSVMVRQKISCDDEGNFTARIPTDEVLSGGVYYLRAYTNLMRNFSSESFALQPLLIGKTFPKDNHNFDYNLKCDIYPDGGYIVENNIQGITIALSEDNGRAIADADVSLIENGGDTICAGKTSMSGLLNFKYIPQSGKRYMVAVNSNSKRFTADVPKAISNRMKLQCTAASGNRLKFEILNARKKLDNCRLYIYNKENGIVNIDKVKASGIITMDKHANITTAFLTDSIGNILSEATAIASYDMQELPMIPDTINVNNIATLSNKFANDSSKRIKLRLADNNEQWMPFAESELQYLSDYRSPLPFPENFFRENVTDRASDLQAWMSTATFKRFHIADAVTMDSTIYKSMPETAMTISGTVIGMDRHPCKGGTVVAYNTENNCVYDTDIKNDGRFRMAVDNFDEGTTFFLQTMDKHNKPIESQIEIDNEVYPAVAHHRRYTLSSQTYAESKIDVNGIMTGSTLPDVEVKARVKRDKPISRKKYYELDYTGRSKIEQRNYTTLLDILNGMPTVNVKYSDNEDKLWVISSNRGVSTLNDRVYLPLLVDGTRIPKEQNDMILCMSAEDIEEVEVLRPWQVLAYTWGAIDGAINVVTRRPSKASNISSKGTFYTPKGLSTIKATNTNNITLGQHRLLVDIISQDGVTSYERDVFVTE